MNAPLQDRFWARVKKTEVCWVWNGGGAGCGYGQIMATRNGKRVRHYAHRLSFEWANGPIPDGMCVCHHCDNPPCVRPDHLFLGTYLENTQDAQRKGRRPIAAPKVPDPRVYADGSQLQWARLTDALVRRSREVA